jgi:hypothetical protein
MVGVMFPLLSYHFREHACGPCNSVNKLGMVRRIVA